MAVFVGLYMCVYGGMHKTNENIDIGMSLRALLRGAEAIYIFIYSSGYMNNFPLSPKVKAH